MRRFLALLITSVLGTLSTAVTPAAAQVSECGIVEQVFGVNLFGDLIVQPFCAQPREGYLQPRTLASFGEQVPQLFYGGQFSDATVFIYGVAADGTLHWYRENGATGRLDPGVPVGAQFGDWRNYQNLQTTGNGDLSGIDAQGRLWRWVHWGWEDGTDIWTSGGPADAGCPGMRPVFTGRDGPARYVGVAASSYVYCGHNGESSIASLLPAGITAVTMAAGPGVAYGLRPSDGRLTRMVLDPRPEISLWRNDAVARVPLAAIFTGRSIIVGGPPPSLKYEWQWTWYEKCL